MDRYNLLKEISYAICVDPSKEVVGLEMLFNAFDEHDDAFDEHRRDRAHFGVASLIAALLATRRHEPGLVARLSRGSEFLEVQKRLADNPFSFCPRCDEPCWGRHHFLCRNEDGSRTELEDREARVAIELLKKAQAEARRHGVSDELPF